jgi:choline-sulfatase
MPDRPNIVYICSDQHSYRFTGYAGHPLVRTPNLDRLAARGTVFRNAYCGSPVCVPGRASLMTGMYASDCGSFCNSTVWDGSHPTWGTMMGEAGYSCHATGKFDLNWDFDLGFHLMEVTNGHCRNPDITSLFRRPPLGHRAGSREGLDGGTREKPHRDSGVAAIAVDFLRSRSKDLPRPWLLYVGFTQPHSPYRCLPKHWDLYPRDRVDLPDVTDEELESLPLTYQLRRSSPATSLPVPEERIRRARAAYYGMVTELDEYVGSVVRALEETGQLDDTLVLYTSDHGDSLGEHGMWAKSILYEDAAHVPLVVAGPGVPRGADIETAVAHVDLVPTMLEIAGGDRPSRLRGHSLLPLLAGGKGDHPGFAFVENHSGGNTTGSYAIREGDWKLLHFTWAEELLFNVAEDPLEKRNRIYSPEGRAIADRLRGHLTGEVDPEAVTRRAFDAQRQFLDAYAASRTEDELTAAFESRMGRACARMMAAKCKSGSVG